MAGGPFTPISATPVTADRVFESVHVCAGAGFKRVRGLGVQASVGADSIWELAFQVPASLPSGACKLKGYALANATSGAARFSPRWASCAAEEDPSGLTLQNEGTQTITWGAGDNDQLKAFEVALDGDTPVADELIVMQLTFETTSWTLAATSTWLVWVEFE